MGYLIDNIVSFDDFIKSVYTESNRTKTVAYITLKGDNLSNDIVFFGIKKVCYDLNKLGLSGSFNSDSLRTNLTSCFGSSIADTLVSRLNRLLKLSHLPIKVSSLEEGSFVPFDIPVARVENTLYDFGWLVEPVANYIKERLEYFVNQFNQIRDFYTTIKDISASGVVHDNLVCLNKNIQTPWGIFFNNFTDYNTAFSFSNLYSFPDELKVIQHITYDSVTEIAKIIACNNVEVSSNDTLIVEAYKRILAKNTGDIILDVSLTFYMYLKDILTSYRGTIYLNIMPYKNNLLDCLNMLKDSFGCSTVGLSRLIDYNIRLFVNVDSPLELQLYCNLLSSNDWNINNVKFGVKLDESISDIKAVVDIPYIECNNVGYKIQSSNYKGLQMVISDNDVLKCVSTDEDFESKFKDVNIVNRVTFKSYRAKFI